MPKLKTLLDKLVQLDRIHTRAGKNMHSMHRLERIDDFRDRAYDNLMTEMLSPLREETHISPSVARGYLSKIQALPEEEINALEDPRMRVNDFIGPLPLELRHEYTRDLLRFIDENEPERMDVIRAWSDYLY